MWTRPPRASAWPTRGPCHRAAPAVRPAIGSIVHPTHAPPLAKEMIENNASETTPTTHQSAQTAIVCLASIGQWEGHVVTDVGYAPVSFLPEKRRAHSVFLGHTAVFAIGATSSIQVANVTLTALSVVCLLLVPGWLLMTHRGVDLVPLVLAALGWSSFLVSCLGNDTSVLCPTAVAPAAFGLYLMGLTVLTGRAVDAIAAMLAGLAVGTVVFFLTVGIALTHTGNFMDLWKYGIASAITVLMLYVLTAARAPAWVMPAS